MMMNLEKREKQIERNGKKEEQVPYRRIREKKRGETRHRVTSTEGEKRKEITRAFTADGGLNM